MIPEKIGRYTILSELGRGAMGVVYRAYDPNIGREVALKTIRLDQQDPQMVERFRREAHTAGTLSHPNIVTIFDAGEDNGVFYIAMELLEGQTLHQLIEHGPLPVELAISIAEQIGEALDYAHARPIVHRDIKPANIMVSQGRVKVMDFGLAKIASSRLTTTGLVAGTPAYMSPEQAKGAAVDGRSDIFSLGTILYEMLTGVMPFQGEHLTAVVFKVVSEEPLPPTSVNASLHPGLNRVVLKAMAKDPAHRYQTCGDLIADLRNYAALESAAFGKGQPVQVQPSKRSAEVAAPPSVPVGPRWKRAVVVLAGAVLVVLGAGLYLQLRQSPESPTTPPAVQPVAPSVPAPPPAVSAPAAPARPTPSQPAAPAAPGNQVRSQTVPAPIPRAPAPPPPEPSRPTAETAPRQPARSLPSEPTPSPPQLPASPPASGAVGRVVIHTQPEGARVLVNGEETRYRTPVNFALPAGKQRITVERPGYDSESEEIIVRENQTVQKQFELKPNGERRRRLPFRR